MIVKIINKSKNELPKYETLFSAGMDLRANLEESIVLKPSQRLVVKTGLFISLQQGYEAQIRPRSGLALKKGVTVLNSPGTIDADFRGEIQVILINHGQKQFTIEPGFRIAQLVISYTPNFFFEEGTIETLETERSENGFGSTGLK